MVKAFNKERMDDYIEQYNNIVDEVTSDTDFCDSSSDIESDLENDTSEEEDKSLSTDTIVDELCMSLNQVNRLPCAAHNLQLAIKDGLKLESASDLIIKVLIFIQLK